MLVLSSGSLIKVTNKSQTIISIKIVTAFITTDYLFRYKHIQYSHHLLFSSAISKANKNLLGFGRVLYVTASYLCALAHASLSTQHHHAMSLQQL